MPLPPPASHCPTCPSELPGQGSLQTNRRPGYTYIIDISGVNCMQHYLYYCCKCHTISTPGCFTHEDAREYHTLREGQQQFFFQVSRHNFMSYKIADHFNQLQMLARVPIFDLVAAYNHTHAPWLGEVGAQTLSESVCTGRLDIHRWIRSSDERLVRSKSLRNGCQAEQRFFPAMVEHLECISLHTSDTTRHVKDFILEVFTSTLPQVISYNNATESTAHLHANSEHAHRFRHTTILPHLQFRIATCHQFDSSAAQSIFAWLGQFKFMFRNMHSTRYQFVLQELIRARNNLTSDQLMASGQMPY